MTDWEVVGMVGMLLFYAAVGLGSIVAVTLAVKFFCGETREQQRLKSLEVVDRVEAYTDDEAAA